MVKKLFLKFCAAAEAPPPTTVIPATAPAGESISPKAPPTAPPTTSQATVMSTFFNHLGSLNLD